MDPTGLPFWSTAAVVAFLVSAVGVGWLARDRLPAARGRLTDRFMLGVPWGSIIVLGLVLGVYLFVQDGISTFHRPVYVPFVNWSYLYPLGVVTAPFAHGSATHLLGNLTTAMVLAPLAEYIWGHYPRRRWGRVPARSDRRYRDRPAVRAFLIVPGVLVGVALLTSAFSWGPVIGFSGVVYALAGFTVVRFPIVTLVALLFRTGIREFGATLFEPVVEATTNVSMSTPGWVGVAFQGHGFGFLVGAFLGIMLLHRRRADVAPVRIWLGLILVMIVTSLWAIWGARGGDVYVLYRGLGFTLIFLVALLLTVAVAATDRPIIGWLTRRRTALVGLGLVILLIAGIAVPFNLLVVSSDYTPPDSHLDVAGYDVFYAESTPNALRPVLALNEEPSNASGVIVVDEDRHLWTEAVSRNTLSFGGRATVAIGDAFAREEVTATRRGWSLLGNGTVYVVELEHANASRPVFASDRQQANATLAGHEIAVEAEPETGFQLVVTAPDGEAARAPIPARNTTTELGELEFVREGDRLVAHVEETQVPIARRVSA